MCTRTRRHARFRIAFVEFVQYEDHRYQTRRRQQSIQSGLLARPKRRCDDRIQLLFLIRTTTSRMFGLIIPCRPRKRQGNNSGSKSRNNVTIYRKPKSQRLKHPRNHKQTEPMKPPVSTKPTTVLQAETAPPAKAPTWWIMQAMLSMM